MKKIISSFTLAIMLAGLATGQPVVTSSLVLGGTLSGLDQNNNAAVYSFGLGYGDDTGSPTFFAVSSVSATTLSALTTADLLTATYNNLEGQLPANLQSDLTLDLADNALDFSVSGSVIVDPSVESSCTDTGLSYTTGLSVSGDPWYSISPVPGSTVLPLGVTVYINGNNWYGTCSTSSDYNTMLQNVANLLNGGLTSGGQTINLGASVSDGEVWYNAPAGSFNRTGLAITGGTPLVIGTSVPEASTLALLGVAAVSLLAAAGRRRTLPA